MSCRSEIKRWPHAYDSYDVRRREPLLFNTYSYRPIEYDFSEAEDFKI
jgi:hypothetical protein